MPWDKIPACIPDQRVHSYRAGEYCLAGLVRLSYVKREPERSTPRRAKEERKLETRNKLGLIQVQPPRTPSPTHAMHHFRGRCFPATWTFSVDNRLRGGDPITALIYTVPFFAPAIT
jgi:hypothetical protein